MDYLFAPPLPLSIPIIGKDERFPVHRIYCLVRNYEDHAKEMGGTGLEDPFFFLKPADIRAVLVIENGQVGTLAYPTLTHNFHHEVELVIAIGTSGQNIQLSDAEKHIYGYAVGLDMTRRDLQVDMAKQGHPWCIGKAFDQSAVIGSITPAASVSQIATAQIHLKLNEVERQRSTISQLIWQPAKIIEQLSRAWALQPGDLIYTGTPGGVGAVVPGDFITAHITGLQSLAVRVEK